MGSVRNRGDKLFIDFRFEGKRCREQTLLNDTKANRKLLQQLLSRVESEISLGTFDYAATFPGSKMLNKLKAKVAVLPNSSLNPIAGMAQDCGSTSNGGTPPFRDFVETWLQEFSVGWRRSHIATVRSTLDRHLVPYFGDQKVGSITKADVLQFRSQLAKVKGRNGNASLAAKTINRTVQLLGQILSEAADRFHFINPVEKVKPLKSRRPDIHPFSMEEVQRLLAAVREDYRDYLLVRFMSGMRTGEINGLQWRYVDFERRQIRVRETIVRGKVDETKTEGSLREIEMTQPVFEALSRQQAITGHQRFVFCNREGAPIDLDNFTNRVWYPLLRYLGLEKRRPYQTRHTFATLALAAGENPQFVAQQLGHANTAMLFNVYSRYVPNLTRRDGSAFDRMMTGAMLTAAPVMNQEVDDAA